MNIQPDDGHWKGPKHVVVIDNICIPAEANKLSCVLTTSYIVFMFTHTTGYLTLKGSSLYSVHFYQTARRHVTEGGTPPRYHLEYPISHRLN
jgi:hypothetical protein